MTKPPESIAFMNGFYEGNKAAWEKRIIAMPYDEYLKMVKQKPEIVTNDRAARKALTEYRRWNNQKGEVK